MTLAFVFPGQGSQSVGMLHALAAEYPVVKETFAEASQALGKDLWQLVEQGPETRLNQTEITQPVMLAAGVATWRAWLAANGPPPQTMAGHSLGEYTALVCAEALDFADAVKLVRIVRASCSRRCRPGRAAWPRSWVWTMTRCANCASRQRRARCWMP